ncbi:hypothetical protein A3B45_01090 [Candidatus Daviesbacteria bacterium RIFCSPLOWO2_01_FULL_39_12]|uniref:Uncharacterized protein n=1 Tax=Candidatus Daviesbacteria bacterium RIFCSPLOWO2_01_FULL_39_12 TaxID=1797785 RepID=A0A1F5KTB6_9BACT|nr:MAG: hypothetical protein A3D79_03020 [Candidatus Daviesbacteria bacterium RIFCSPHIGHO2_02_FULL_39_8]OGE44162.1 MAG: hypothetical protein A3B45_01090 [Candidatus Daviesbacteria bacterium RIFCSPLOWO2_01_FULL_39_12]
MNKTLKVLFKIILSVVAVPVSFSILGVIYALYKSQSVSVGTNLISMTPNPLDFLMNIMFIVAIFAVPGIIIWLIWKKI